MAAADNIDRRRFGQTLAACGLASAASYFVGCTPSAAANDFGELDLAWSRQGLAPGRLQKPRAMAIDAQDRIYIVDFTARVQVFDPDGKFLLGWKTPASKDGRPTGISIDADGTVMVADTHYYRVLFYTPEGKLLEERTIGGTVGSAPGEFGFVTDAVRAADGSLFVSEYSQNDRIQKFAPDGSHLLQWGEPGSGPGEFRRPQSLLLDGQGQLVVSDSCNHRLQIFDQQGSHLATWANEGSGRGELYYPYGLTADATGNMYVCEYGNHRVQKFGSDGKSLGIWGRQGRQPGELWDPWAVVVDSAGRLHVLDTGNHRVQRIVM